MVNAISDVMRGETTAIKAALVSRMERLAYELLGRPHARAGKGWRYRRNDSLAIAVFGPKAGFWYDFEADKGGDVLSLIMFAREYGFAEAKQYALEFLGGSLPTDAVPPAPEIILDADDPVRVADAMTLWNQATDPRGTVVEAYLASRKLPLPDFAAGNTIRFIPPCGSKVVACRAWSRSIAIF